MTKFRWTIDTDNFLHNLPATLIDTRLPPQVLIEDKMSAREFLKSVCGQLNSYSETYTLEQLKSGCVDNCHSHTIDKVPPIKTLEYKRLFGKLQDINTKLGNNCGSNNIPNFLGEEDILQIALNNINQKFRCFGYILDDIFYLIYLDPSHKIYPVAKKKS